MDELTNWLASGRDFEAGLALYNRHGLNPTRAGVMDALGATDLTLGWLVADLKAERDRLQAQAPVVRAVEVAQRRESSALRPSDRPDAPKSIRDAVERRKALYKAVGRDHRELVLSVENETLLNEQERCKLAYRILETWDEIDQLWALTNAYDQTGTVPPPPAPVPEIKLKAGQTLTDRRNTLRTYLTPGYLSRKPEAGREAFRASCEAELLKIEQVLQDETGNDT